MVYIFMAVFAALIVLADQLSKVWVVENIAAWVCNDSCIAHLETLEKFHQIPAQETLPKVVEGVPGIFNLVHVHNTGAAWSSFQGQQWLFALIFIAFAGFILWEFPKKRLGFKTFERWCIVSVFAGGLGNMIDRLRLGFVVDMVHLEFLNFPIFNVADCFICCGCILLILHLLLFNKEFWKEEK